jgi:N-acetylmuramoyl-L-alanine amidase
MSTIRSILYSKLAAVVVSFTLFNSTAHALETLEPEVKKEVTCLAKNIYYEAGLEHYEGRLAVAQVTVNRSEHDAFPDSICGVVYHKTQARSTGKTVCQFSWVCEPNRRKINYASERWENSLSLAKDVILDGLRLDTLENALYFHNTLVNPRWGLERITRIGGHIFYSEQRTSRR